MANEDKQDVYDLDFDTDELAAAMASEEGQPPGGDDGDSPASDSPADGKKGQESDSPADKDEPEPEPDNDGEDDSDDDKPLPFDKDPKWKAARADQKRFQEILEENDLEDSEDLVSQLKTGKTLVELLGTADAKEITKILEKAQTLDKYEEIWAQQDAQKREESETPEETIERLKHEKEAEKKKFEQFKASEEERAESKRVLKEYEKNVTGLIDGDEILSDNSKAVVKLLMGISNPSEEIDPTNLKAVKTTTSDMIKRVNELVAAERQKAIDDYAAGKLETPPMKKGADTDSPGTKSVKHTELPEGGVEEAFDQITSELFEVLNISPSM